MTFQLTSEAFAPGQPIPAKYSCDGQDSSPPLQWSDPPAGTRSFTLIMDDPDAPAGVWDHWLLFNLPADTRSLAERATPPAGTRGGRNSWGRTGYGGPCPPRGTHRYFFKLYALDTNLELAAGATKKELLQAMEGHLLAQAELMGTYARK
jgi:Raf kinase inhibitor-like YbhB/YbcL family protein